MERYRQRLPRFRSRVGATLRPTANTTIHIISAHLPHHATLDQTQQLLQTWQDNRPQLHHHPCVIGADWNETFNTHLHRATPARGDHVLEWMSTLKQSFPPQQDSAPTFHPYNKAMRSRRIDYISSSRHNLRRAAPIEGSRDVAFSDHDAFMAEVHARSHAGKTKRSLTHHPIKIKMLGVLVPPPPPAAHLGTVSPNLRSIAQKPQTQAGHRADPCRPKKATLEIHPVKAQG